MEGSNYARLCCLLMEEGTDRVRRAVLANMPDPALGFRANIANCRSKMEGLRRKKVINNLQFETLYPSSGCSPRLASVDMTLWIVLARNVCKGRHNVNWTSYPTPLQTKWQHDLLRLRDARNFLFHLHRPGVDDDTFLDKWNDVAEALKRLGTDELVIDSYKERDLDPIETHRSKLKVREQVYDELQCIIKSERYNSRFLKIATAIAAVLMVVVLCSTAGPIAIFLTRTRPCEYNVQTVRTGICSFGH